MKALFQTRRTNVLYSSFLPCCSGVNVVGGQPIRRSFRHKIRRSQAEYNLPIFGSLSVRLTFRIYTHSINTDRREVSNNNW